MLRIMRYVGESLVLTTEQGDIVIKVDTLRALEGKPQVYLAVSAPQQIRVTREPR